MIENHMFEKGKNHLPNSKPSFLGSKLKYAGVHILIHEDIFNWLSGMREMNQKMDPTVKHGDSLILFMI